MYHEFSYTVLSAELPTMNPLIQPLATAVGLQQTIKFTLCCCGRKC